MTRTTLFIVLIAISSILMLLPSHADTDAVTATEDVIYMADGRVLHGQIIDESNSDVTFQYRDPNIGITATLTLKRIEIAQIDRNVPTESIVTEVEENATVDDEDFEELLDVPTRPGRIAAEDLMGSYGPMRFRSTNPNVPGIYIVPLKGQMGTDIRAAVYEDVIDDIRAHRPDLVILEVDCSESSEMLYPEGYDAPTPEEVEKRRRRERGLLDFEDYRDLVHMFRDDLRDINQVAWIRDSEGISATVIMAWDKLYMAPTARLGGMVSVLQLSGATAWPDADVRAKMIAAHLGIAKGFMEKGGYSLALADAMLSPEYKLSGNWRGRTVDWQLNDRGEYLVDDSEERTANFTAKSAEDFCITQGTAAGLDDLMLLLGIREYSLVIGRQYELTDGYVEAWRRAYEKTKKLWIDFAQHQAWATGDEEIRWLGRAKSDLEKIIAAMKRYPAVERRWENDEGQSRFQLEIVVEQITERLQALRSGGRGGTGGRQRGGGVSQQ